MNFVPDTPIPSTDHNDKLLVPTSSRGSELSRDLPSLIIHRIPAVTLGLAGTDTIGLRVARVPVVLREGERSRLRVLDVGHDVHPVLVVVDSDGDHEDLPVG